MDRDEDGRDHIEYESGFVELVEHMGSLDSVVRNARVSYQSGTTSTRQDHQLVRYLVEHHHWSPFECVYFTFHIKCPIYIARQVMRHRSFTFNELSARYSVLDQGVYSPSSYSAQHHSKRQCRSGEPVEQSELAQAIYLEAVNKAERAYRDLIALGVARETARGVLPTASYTRFYMSGNLRSYYHFIGLRDDEHAQSEVQDLARGIKTLVSAKGFEIMFD